MISGFAADVIGLVGSIVFIAAYAYVTFASSVNKLWSNAANIVGAILLLTSLSIHFNLAAFVLETAWGLIAVTGLASELLKRR